MKPLLSACRLALLLISSMALAWALPVRAEAPVSKIGVVDLDRLITTSEPGRKLIEPLDAQLKQKQEEASAMENALNSLRTKAEKESMTATEKQRRAWQREYDDKLQQMRQFDAEASRDLDKSRAQAVMEFMRLAKPAIESVGKELGYQVILRKEGASVLYADGASDLTGRIVERLNGRTPEAK